MSEFEKNCRWHFAEQLGGADIGPNEAMSENFKKNRYASLIREAIQNSLDAVDNVNAPVVVSFQFERKEIDPSRFPNFFELKEDIMGCIEFYSGNQNAKDKYLPMQKYMSQFVKPGNNTMPYLAISDYNTKGMDYQDGNTNCPFYAFVQSIGVTNKSSNSAGGSFGFGKAAYFGLSQISTMLVSTRTKEERCFFEGISSLCTHTKDGKKRTAIGFYDNNNGRPIECEKDIPNRFLRDKGDGSGTNFYIMGIDKGDINSIIGEMKDAVLRNFWLSIYRKKLIVKINREEITSENIAGLIEKRFQDFVDTNNRATYNPRPYFDAVRFANSKSNSRLFERQLPRLGRVCFYTLTNKEATDRISYMRAPLMLVYARKYQTNHGFYGVFVCEDNKGNELLRKMENPAHDEWKENNWQSSSGRTVPEAKETIKELESFIKDCINELFKTSSSGILKIIGLENYLYIPTSMENDEESIIEDAEIENGNEEEQVVSVQSKLSSKAPKVAEQKLSVGKVLVEKRTKATVSPGGQLYSGHSSKVSKTKGGGAGSRNLTMTNVPDEKGKTGTYAEAVSVRYRTFAQKKQGEMLHYIIVHSDKEIEDGKISLLVAGEQVDDKIKIVRSNMGKHYQNIISKLHFMPGRNEIVVKLDDEMKHALKLDIYEHK